MKVYSGSKKTKFPKVGSTGYSSLLAGLIEPFKEESEKEKTAERVMLSSFQKELEKLSFGWDYLGKALGASLVGEMGSEVVHRALYGDKASRGAGQILKDGLTGTIFHAPFAAAAHYAPGAIASATQNAVKGTWQHSAGAVANTGADLLKSFTSPIGTTMAKTVMPVIDYATGHGPFEEEEKKKKSFQVAPLNS